jgi:hypothetical protein
MKKIILIILLGILIFIFAGVAFLAYDIHAYVRNISEKAKAEYNLTYIDSLSKVVASDTWSFKDRNDAVWALGQIADERALPVLKKYYTGIMPEREPLNKVLSQYEIQKAIKWCEKGNWVSWMHTKYRK